MSILKYIQVQAKGHAILTNYRRGFSIDDLSMVYKIPKDVVRLIVNNAGVFDNFYAKAMTKSKTVRIHTLRIV